MVDTDDWVSPDAFPDDIVADTLPLEYDGLNMTAIQTAQETEFRAERLAVLNYDSDYTVINAVLYIVARPHPTAATYPRLLLPSAFRDAVITRAHNQTRSSGS